ncbi:MAG: hypothetical protein OXF63_13080 [Anaerolineaceae bacterium]|nr:hypothetical protein [Anaerolineaceae bacterium]
MPATAAHPHEAHFGAGRALVRHWQVTDPLDPQVRQLMDARQQLAAGVVKGVPGEFLPHRRERM